MKLWILCSLFFMTRVSARIFRENMYTTTTIFTRSTQYVPEVKYKVCLLRPQEGPCRSKISMFYFKKSIMRCAPFDWGGCQGNGNRFDTEQECLDYCLTKEGYTPPPPAWCQLTFDYGRCFGEVERFYFDPIGKVCKTAKYSGCGGNNNKFRTKEGCESVCLFGKNLTTQDPKDQTTRDHGFSRVIIVDPEETPAARASMDATTNAAHDSTPHGNRVVPTNLHQYIFKNGTVIRFTVTVNKAVVPEVTGSFLNN